MIKLNFGGVLMQDLSVPVIAIDGGVATGTGTARYNVAKFLGWNELDSGMLYRALGHLCDRHRVSTQDIARIVQFAKNLNIKFFGEEVFLDDIECGDELRSERTGFLANDVAGDLEVRTEVRVFQELARVRPGLATDGRDTCDVYITPHRFFFTVDLRVAAERVVKRSRQNKRNRDVISFDAAYDMVKQRDLRDRTRPIAPLRAHPEAETIDTSEIEPLVLRDLILAKYEERNNAGSRLVSL